jgi:hypothetical protein
MAAAECETQPLNRGRQTKFTPEKIRQITNLLERGKSREEIAEIIGVTVGTLQVTCSKLGISLRRPIFDPGTGLLRRRPHSNNGDGGSQPHRSQPHRLNGNTALKRPSEQPQPPQQILQERNVEQGQSASPHPPTHSACANFVITMTYKGEQRSTELPFTQDMMRQLVFEAAIRDMRIGEFVAELILAITRKDLFQLVLEPGLTAAKA